MNYYTDVLPKIPQWEDIPYAADLQCQECGKGNFENYNMPNYKEHAPIAVGWCETPNGYMGVFECPFCWSKFRFHCGGHKLGDIDDFNFKFHQWLFMCQNYQELRKNMKKNLEINKI